MLLSNKSNHLTWQCYGKRGYCTWSKLGPMVQDGPQGNSFGIDHWDHWDWMRSLGLGARSFCEQARANKTFKVFYSVGEISMDSDEGNYCLTNLLSNT